MLKRPIPFFFEGNKILLNIQKEVRKNQRGVFERNGRIYFSPLCLSEKCKFTSKSPKKLVG